MAHEIHESDRFGEVRSNGKRAWHGLGDEIQEGLTAREAFTEIGLDWETELAPVYAKVGGKEVKIGGKGQGGQAPMAHLRSDSHQLLGMVTEGYQPMQNMELAEFADALAGADKAVTIETAGSLYNSRRVFALVRLPKVIRAAKGDEMKQYILVQNGHGGFAALSCFPTSIRVVCANTLRWSEQTDEHTGLKFRHSGDWEEKLQQARIAIGIATEQTERFEEQVKALVGVGMSHAALERYMAETYDLTFHGGKDMSEKPENMSADVFEKLTVKRAKLIETWMANLADERQNIKGIRGTAWAAYNAVSQWHDHERGRFSGIEESDARVASNIFGVSQDHKSRAFRKALQLV